ncbi:hypothetical protein [Oceanospirillum maris]|uniref:hypothetical protein n=1 Tax=Oceanospirillum maris TaxID=64977 RepID=UPI000407E909|nr:hypothetical protein [Oceanospirillum maris]
MITVVAFKTKFSEIVSMSPEEIHDDTQLDSLIEWDSLAMVGMAALLFEISQTTSTADEITELKTFKDLVSLAYAKGGIENAE